MENFGRRPEIRIHGNAERSEEKDLKNGGNFVKDGSGLGVREHYELLMTISMV